MEFYTILLEAYSLAIQKNFTVLKGPKENKRDKDTRIEIWEDLEECDFQEVVEDEVLAAAELIWR